MSVKMFYEAQRSRVDNLVFWGYGGFTTKLLLIFAAVSALFQFFGQPITCPESNPEVITSYCRKYGVYSSCGLPADAPSFSFHWVTFYLLQQAFTMYLPCLLWRKLEGKTMEKLVLASKKGEILRCLNNTRGTQHRMYWIKFHICQMYNILSAVVNVVSYFYIAIDYDDLLPYELVCNFFSSSNHTTCYIPGNIANQLFIIVAFYWNAILIAVGLFYFIAQSIFAASPFVRNAFLHYALKPLNEEDLKQVVYTENWATLFLVEQLAWNMNREEFWKFISELAADKKTKKNIAP